PEGYARLDARALAAARPEIGWRALSALLATVGGLDYAPRDDAVRALYADLCAGRLGGGRTLAGCRLVPDGDALLLVRELRGIETIHVATNPLPKWDGRFDLRVRGFRSKVNIAALGPAGWAEIVARAPRLRATPMPYPARLALPAVRDRDGVLAVPALGYRRGGGRKINAIATMRPVRPLAGAVFAAAKAT